MKNESVYEKMSNAEKQVADFLYDLNIWWNYQRPVVVEDEGERQRTWYPDFFLSEFGIYIEVCGAEREKDYSRREKVYKKNKIPIIFVQTYKDEKKWKIHLLSRIVDIQGEREGILLSSMFEKVFQSEK